MANTRILLIALFLILAGCSNQSPATQTQPTAVPPLQRVVEVSSIPTTLPLPNQYYVSPQGNNSDGRSWATAWNELDQIHWEILAPGSMIWLDGGASEQIYRTILQIGTSGTPDRPIKIMRAEEPGHNGRVVIDGGLTFWPCQASQPSPYTVRAPEGTRPYGINFNKQSWVEIDGREWGGIIVRNHTESGIRLRDVDHIRLANLEIHNNTYPDTPDGPGIEISGDQIILERLDIHHNGQDAIQGGNVNGLVLRDSHLHDHYCNHPDGIQLYRGQNSNILIERNRFETGFLQAIFLGEPNPKQDSTTSDVTIAYNLIRNTDYGAVSNHSRNQNWKIYNNTIVDIEKNGIQLYEAATEMAAWNNILDRAGYVMREGVGVQGHNLFHNVEHPPLENGSIKADPQFIDRTNGDFRLQSTSPGIDAGQSLGNQADLQGTPVPTGNGTDIGAFEYTSNAPSP